MSERVFLLGHSVTMYSFERVYPWMTVMLQDKIVQKEVLTYINKYSIYVVSVFVTLKGR